MKTLIIDENILMSSKLQTLSNQNGFETKVLSFAKFELINEFKPDLIIINLESKANDITELLKDLKNYKTIGYCNYRKIDLAKETKEIGINFVATNSSIVLNFDEIIKHLNS